MTKLALVIPAFKEQHRLPPFAKDLAAEVANSSLADRLTILVVDDGSPPPSHDKLQSALSDLENWKIAYDGKNRGKGGAVFWGWEQLAEESDYSHMAFVDADGSVPAVEVIRLLELAEKNPDTAFFGSRIKMMGRTIERRLLRHLLGRVFTTMLSLAIDLPVYDSQCGLKVIPLKAYKHAAQRVSITGFAFDVELLAALTYSGTEVHEVPIDWRDCPGSKLRLIRDSVNMAVELLNIRKRAKSGFYS